MLNSATPSGSAQGSPSDLVLEGKITRLVFDANSGEFRVFELQADDKSTETVRQYANGSEMTPIKKGDHVRLHGKYIRHKQYGRQFVARDLVRRTPTTPQGVAKILSGKEFKGIGPKAAQRLVDELGSELLSVLNRGDPGELIAEILGDKKAKSLIETWLKNQAGHNTEATLADLGIGALTRKKIRETIPDIETVLQTNPYRLAQEIEGIGFKTADQLAQRAGTFRADSPQRLAVGVMHAIDTAGQDGHTGLSQAQLIDKTCELLTFGDRRTIERVINEAIERGDLQTSPNDLIQQRWTAMREIRLARNIVKLAQSPGFLGIPREVIHRHALAAKAEFKLTDEQFEAVIAGLTQSMVVITGGPGTGKTTTLKALIQTAKRSAAECRRQIRFQLMAPAGKAADRMSESTGCPASTIHSALGRNEDGAGGFLHDDKNPWDCEIVIADEFSMVDTRIGDAAFRAIKPGKTGLIMVGDIDQLPSVEAGRVLHDIIQSQICPVVRLTRIHRTGEGSAIALAAAQIKEGKTPQFSPPGKSDFVIIELDDPNVAADRIVNMVARAIPSFTGCSPDDIQVLAPGKNSPVGTISLNARLQEALNPTASNGSNSQAISAAIANGQKARIGDRVLCNKNSKSADRHEEPVYNGDLGVVEDYEEIDDGGESLAFLTLSTSKKRLELERAYWQNIALAYAMTIHKSQGSEFHVVVIPMMMSHFMLLKRPVFYTGVTRAKKLCVIIGSRKAIQRALATTDGTSRQTGLLSRIRIFAKLN